LTVAVERVVVVEQAQSAAATACEEISEAIVEREACSTRVRIRWADEDILAFGLAADPSN
jgi:hypothetical protein